MTHNGNHVDQDVGKRLKVSHPKVHPITNHRNLQFNLIFSTLAAADIQLLVTRWSKWHDIYSRQVSDTISWRKIFILYTSLNIYAV